MQFALPVSEHRRRNGEMFPRDVWFEQRDGTCQCSQIEGKQSTKAVLSKWRQKLYLSGRRCHGEDRAEYGIIAQ